MKQLLTVTAAMLLLASCSSTDKTNNTTGNGDTAVLQTRDNLSAAKIDRTNWDQVDFTSPIVRYDEIKSREIEVREKGKTSIFTIDEDILFDFDKSAVKKTGEGKLDEIAAAIKKRYPTGDIGIYGYTDSVGSKDYNKQLSEERAMAVKQYLQGHTSIDMSRINTYAKGESNPVATNSTEKGRSRNRRVDIVAQANQ